MAKYSASWTSVTSTAFADTTGMTDNAYMAAIQGANSTQRLVYSEVYIGGEASASTVKISVLARDSTVAGTLVAGGTRNAALDGAATAPGSLAVVGNSATTDPQRSSTLHLLHLSFNAFGGVVRWVAAPGNELSTVGNAASLGELSLSDFTGSASGVTSGHIIYEVV